MDRIPRQNQFRFQNDLYVFVHAAPYYYTRTELYLASLQQESSQTHHPIPQYVMLMNQLSLFFIPKMIFAIHIWMSNPREPPQVYSLLLTFPFFFKYFTDQRLKYILQGNIFISLQSSDWRNSYFLIILLRNHNRMNQQVSLEIKHSF